jgi:hypothetical protein
VPSRPPPVFLIDINRLDIGQDPASFMLWPHETAVFISRGYEMPTRRGGRGLD